MFPFEIDKRKARLLAIAIVMLSVLIIIIATATVRYTKLPIFFVRGENADEAETYFGTTIVQISPAGDVAKLTLPFGGELVNLTHILQVNSSLTWDTTVTIDVSYSELVSGVVDHIDIRIEVFNKTTKIDEYTITVSASNPSVSQSIPMPAQGMWKISILEYSIPEGILTNLDSVNTDVATLTIRIKHWYP